ncbi:MAG: GAF domain-containing protein, partial [Myxococcales bacterium]|nr:GAF domain-containing protein [Myxococcales bacterium]
MVDRTDPAELESAVELFELLQRTNTTLASKLGLQTVVQTLVDLASELSGARAAALLYQHAAHDRGVFTLAASSGAPWAAFASVSDPRIAPQLTSAVLPDGLLRTGDFFADARYAALAPREDASDPVPVRSYLAAPIVSRSGDVIGRIILAHPERDVFTPRTERAIVALAAQGAIALDNARLYEETLRASEERARQLEAERGMRAALEQAGALKDLALAKLAHDLRAPLNVILGWSEVLMQRLGPDSEHRGGLEVIARNARLQAGLLDGLHDLDRAIATRVALDAKPVELAAVVSPARPSGD